MQCVSHLIGANRGVLEKGLKTDRVIGGGGIGIEITRKTRSRWHTRYRLITQVEYLTGARVPLLLSRRR
jgi:hypothetical protein